MWWWSNFSRGRLGELRGRRGIKYLLRMLLGRWCLDSLVSQIKGRKRERGGTFNVDKDCFWRHCGGFCLLKDWNL